MYAQNVSIRLKSNRSADFTKTLENDVLPVLRKQDGFKDEITFVSPNHTEVVAISLWDRQADADAYARDTYPQVLKTLANLIDGTPEVEAYEVSNSTVHKISARR